MLASQLTSTKYSAFSKRSSTAVKRPLDGFADTARKVNVGRCDRNGSVIFIDADDSVERMLALFGLLLVAGKADDLLSLVPDKKGPAT